MTLRDCDHTQLQEVAAEQCVFMEYISYSSKRSKNKIQFRIFKLLNASGDLLFHSNSNFRQFFRPTSISLSKMGTGHVPLLVTASREPATRKTCSFLQSGSTVKVNQGVILVFYQRGRVTSPILQNYR